MPLSAAADCHTQLPGLTYSRGCCAQAKCNAVAVMLQKPAAQLDRADARCFACLGLPLPVNVRRGMGGAIAAAGLTGYMEFVGVFMGLDPMMKMPGDAVPRRMASLLVELIQSDELPQVLVC
eukprot:COSAG06_NODE_16493_length_998_cov_0.758621_1_plen_121_part_10